MLLNVQIINQSEDVCSVLCRFFRSEGHRAGCNSLSRRPGCGSVRPAVDLFLQAGEERPDLIIIEVSMPEFDAIEMVERLHRSTATRNIPVIVISDFPELEFEFLSAFDFICKPIDIGRLREDINLLIAGARKRAAAVKFPPLTNDEHDKFHDFLILHSGLHFERRNIKALERGLINRMTVLHINSFSDYYEYLSENMERRQELQRLLQHLTVGETFFFRYHAHFEAFTQKVLPQLLFAKKQKKLRIWSAGCSTGEEPYSLVMAIMESIPEWRKLDLKIIATDINNRSLNRAREGVYNAWKVRVTEKKYIDKYFKRIGESYIIKDEVKALVDFSYFNLQASPPSFDETFDVIFCRNVMIYFTTATTRKLVDGFATALNHGGYLFLGHSETLAHISSKFERNIHDGAFFYKKKPEQVEKPVIASTQPVPAAKTDRPLRPIDSSRKQLPVTDGGGVEQLFANGVSLLQQESFSEAAAVFDKLLPQMPADADAILGLGQFHLASGRLDNALDCYNRALAIDDLLQDGYYLRGLLLEMSDRESEAIAEYRKAILLQMDFIMAHYQLGRLYFRSGDHKAGLRELKYSLRILEKSGREAVIPFSGGLSREVFIGRLRDEIQRVETVIAAESA